MKNSGPQQVHLEGYRQMPSILQDFEESVFLDGGMRNGVPRVEALS